MQKTEGIKGRENEILPSQNWGHGRGVSLENNPETGNDRKKTLARGWIKTLPDWTYYAKLIYWNESSSRVFIGLEMKKNICKMIRLAKPPKAFSRFMWICSRSS